LFLLANSPLTFLKFLDHAMIQYICSISLNVQGVCYLLVQALEKHFKADSILFQAFHTPKGVSEEEVWGRLANSPERVRLLAEAEELKRQVK
jgi:hypothetical protein